MRTLVSWLAYNNDFIGDKEKASPTSASGPKVPKKPTEVDPNGPTLEFHRHFYHGYDRHILLSQEEGDDIRLELLSNALARQFPNHKVVPRYMDIKDVIDLKEIKDKVEAFLSTLPSDEELDFFISPGTPAMQTAWYLIQSYSGRARHLWQTRRKDKDSPQERIEAKIEASASPITAILSNQRADDKLKFRTSKLCGLRVDYA
jgi:hypothetical protein